MSKVYKGTGTADKGVIRLDDPEGLPAGRVKVTVEEEAPPLETTTGPVRRSSRQPVRHYSAQDWPYAPEADCQRDWDGGASSFACTPMSSS